MTDYDVVVIGGGPAGMAAALAAEAEGAKVLVLERDTRLGGILNQCIHAGFGLHYFGEELTGPEYAARFAERVRKSSVEVCLEAMVLSLTDGREVAFLSPERGLSRINAGAVVLAMGCRERTAGAINLPGSRPAGVYTAGAAQRLCNIEGQLVGRRVVILGSGDIGLIMARRMTLEGAKVERVIELMPYSSGLKRNIVQCLEDFGIPINYAHTVTRVVGEPRMTGLYYAPVDENRRPVTAEEKFVECDCLLLSVGLIPENDLLVGTAVERDPVTSGAVVDERRMTSVPGIFSCGNVLHVHDLVDNVSREAETAGRCAARYALAGEKAVTPAFKVTAGSGVRYALPQLLHASEDKAELFFRVDNIYRSCRIVVESGGKTLYSGRRMVVAPGEMEKVVFPLAGLSAPVTVRLEI